MDNINFQSWDDHEIFAMECLGSEPSKTSTGYARPFPTEAASHFFAMLKLFVEHHRKNNGYIGRPETHLEQPIMKFFGDIATYDFKPYKVLFEIHGDRAHPEVPCLDDYDDLAEYEEKYSFYAKCKAYDDYRDGEIVNTKQYFVFRVREDDVWKDSKKLIIIALRQLFEMDPNEPCVTEIRLPRQVH